MAVIGTEKEVTVTVLYTGGHPDTSESLTVNTPTPTFILWEGFILFHK